MATSIQDRLKNQDVTRPVQGFSANLIRDGWELRLCPDCHNDPYTAGHFCEHCFGAGAVLVPPNVQAQEHRERMYRWAGIAVLLGLLAAWAVLR